MPRCAVLQSLGPIRRLFAQGLEQLCRLWTPRDFFDVVYFPGWPKLKLITPFASSPLLIGYQDGAQLQTKLCRIPLLQKQHLSSPTKSYPSYYAFLPIMLPFAIGLPLAYSVIFEGNLSCPRLCPITSFFLTPFSEWSFSQSWSNRYAIGHIAKVALQCVSLL